MNIFENSKDYTIDMLNNHDEYYYTNKENLYHDDNVLLLEEYQQYNKFNEINHDNFDYRDILFEDDFEKSHTFQENYHYDEHPDINQIIENFYKEFHNTAASTKFL